MKYRPDIDGIRAIAVLLVLFYHAHFSVIASGFIGVDIFFVISGFLITNIIVSEINATGTFRFINFYKKRLWRLMPVFIALLIIATIISTIFYLPVDFIEFTRSAKNVTLFNSNVYFARTTGGYFSPDINYLTLLHTWSLAVEWQWYAILPCLLYIIYRSLPSQYTMPCIIFLTICAIGISLYLSTKLPSDNYYMLSARVFELLIGSVIAVLPLKTYQSNNLLPKLLISIIGLMSLSYIFFIATRPNILIGFPNYHAIGICTATAALIYIGQIFPRNIITQILSWRPLVFIGLLSYSLYIWHWPIFATIRYLNITETLGISCLLISTSLLMAFTSWYYLERPARKFNQVNSALTIGLLAILPILLMVMLNISVKSLKGMPERFGQQMVNITHNVSKYNQIGREKCFRNPAMNLDPLCKLGAPLALTKKVNALLIGDSFANHFWGFMDVIGRDAQMSIQSNTMPGCLALPKIYVLYNINLPESLNTECHNETRKHYNDIKATKYDFVIISERWSGYMDGRIVHQTTDIKNKTISLERFKSALNDAISQIISSGARPVIIEESFLDPINGDNKCIFHKIKYRIDINKDKESCNSPLTQNVDEQQVHSIFIEMAEKYPQLILIDPKKVQCPEGICLSEIEGLPIFHDQTHINNYASIKLGEMYLKYFGNPFK